MIFNLGLRLLICSAVAIVVADKNYCNQEICRDPMNRNVILPHIACKGNMGFDRTCGNAREEVPMDQDMKKFILNLHNSGRSRLATGKLPNLQSADRMLQMEWDDNLATIAGFNARKCIFDHDKCRNTITYPFSGQNIAMLQASSKYVDDIAAINRMFNNWFDEYKFCNMRAINSYYTPGQDIGHFTQIVNSKSSKVGCSLVKWIIGSTYKTYFVCNYALMNINNQAIYTAGASCSKCTTGCSSALPGLCNLAENKLVEPVPNNYKGNASLSSSSSSASSSSSSSSSSSASSSSSSSSIQPTTQRPSNARTPWNPWVNPIPNNPFSWSLRW